MAKKTATQLRKEYVKTAKSYVGAEQGSRKHHKIVDTFNTVKPDGEVMNYIAPWCAASVTAWAIETFGKTVGNKAFPFDYNCGKLVDKSANMGGWKEADNYKPCAGDLVIFNWDGGAGEQKHGADHVGVVEKVADGYIHTIEGNMGAKSHVGRRTFPIGWQYIRGFISPLYEKIATSTKDTKKEQKFVKSKNKALQGILCRVVSSNGLNVRKGAGLAYKVKTAIPNGTKVRITKQKNGWGYSPALDGWLYMAYLKTI